MQRSSLVSCHLSTGLRSVFVQALSRAGRIGLPLCVLAPLGAAGPALVVQSKTPPPSMKWIEGGNTTIGTKVDEIKAMTETTESLLGVTVLETPQHKMRVDGFNLMVTEVTNEQYAAFVTATGHRPPEHWGDETIGAAQKVFLEEVGKQREEARKAGKPFENKTFSRQDWWQKNWQGKPWKIPTGQETMPVVFVDYSDALAYCAWSGLRLPTEFEYQRAARGNTDHKYPWGDSWDAANAASIQLKQPKPVGAYPKGARDGVFDLSGNVWEWTASPVVAYPGYKDLRFEIGPPNKKRNLDGIGRFNPNQRVVVGGCFQVSEIACRTSTRRPTERSQTVDALGFRCAASPQAGLDKAELILSTEFPRPDWPANAKYDASKTAGMGRWKFSAGTAKSVASEGQPPSPIPGYAVIEGHDHVLFAPASDLETITIKGLGEIDRSTKIAHLGVYSSSIDTLEPKLKKGTYMVSYRAAGRLVEASSAVPPEAPAKAAGEGEKPKGTAHSLRAWGDGLPGVQAPGEAPVVPGGEAKAPQQPQAPVAPAVPAAPAAPEAAPVHAFPEGMDLEVPNLIFSSLDGAPVAFIANPELEIVKPTQPSLSWAVATHKFYETGATGKPELRTLEVELMTMQVYAWCKVSNKSVGMRIPFKFTKGSLDGTWHK